MASTELKELFYHYRLGNLSGIGMVVFMLYIPIGIIFLLFRLLVSIQYFILMMLLPKSFFLRRLIMWFYFALMGMFVTTGSSKNKKDKVNVVVSNHVSLIDSLAIEAVLPSWRLQSHTKLPSWFAWLFGFKNPEIPWMEDVKTLQNNVNNYPFAFFPEEGTTNGKVGLLKFNRNPFKLVIGDLQPLVILLHRPWFIPVRVNYSQSTFWSDLCWMLFVPLTLAHVSYLPAVEIPKDEEQIDEFVDSLQKDMAYVLGIQTTNFSAYEKDEYIKRLLHEEMLSQQQIVFSSSSGRAEQETTINFSRLNTMVEQVKIVLPQVPVDVIRDDLRKTMTVDVTITNLLDGTVQYIPLPKERNSGSNKHELQKISTRTTRNENKILKSYKDRNLSFQEKKRLMIDEARKKYLDLHPEYS